MNSSKDHLEFLSRLAQECEEKRLMLWEYHYDYLAFGNWQIVIGSSKKRMQFSWDGKESLLDVCASSFQNSNSIPSWESALSSISGTKTETEILDVILQSLDEHFAT